VPSPATGPDAAALSIVRLETLAPRRWPKPAVTVGNFDGVHRGHQALVSATREAAQRLDGTAVVLTFDPHPSHVLSPHRAPEALLTVEQKAEILASLGIEQLAVLPFTRALADKDARTFAREVLHDCLGARSVIVGQGFRFGRHREGDAARLLELGAELDFTVQAVAPVLHDGTPISSTRIREALARGEIDAANDLLGRRCFVDGRVRKGEGRGRTLGFPTANLELLNEAVPGGGVYACWARRTDETERRPAVVNVGRRPTFGGGGDLIVEVHLLDYVADLYGSVLRVEFEHKLRDERAFPSIDALKAQIGADADEARRVLRRE
jgi:riboflavin kinase/FMN adenylyltransferase